MYEKINVAFVTDEGYFKPMFVAIESIVRNADYNNYINFYVIDVGIANKSLNKLLNKYNNECNITIKIIKVDIEKLSNFKTKTHVSKAAFAKIYIPNLIKESKLIYLDCDVIFNDNIAKIWNEFQYNVIIKAVWNPFYNYDNKYIGIKNEERTFNSGVMLLNLDLMREKDSSKRMENFLIQFNDKTKLHDQAAFNAIFKDSWFPLENCWNVQVSMLQNHHRKLSISKEEYYKLYINPKIIHFTSNSKPWQFRNCHPHKRKYNKYNKKIFESINYDDLNIISLLKKIKEKSKYYYYYYLNKI